MADVDVPHLLAALAANPAALARLRRSRRARFLAGDLPQAFDWLLDYPDLCAAAHQDAQMRAHTKTPDRCADDRSGAVANA